MKKISGTAKTRKIILLLFSMIISLSIIAQENKNLAELLGYPRDSKLLIIHADDMGLAHSVNTACIMAFSENGINSGSIMVPCPWSMEIISYVRNHPGLDVGVHLTMTAEWKLYKWGGVTSSDQILSLLDKNGNFYPSVEELGKVAKGEEALKELRAQIDKVIAAGIQPTHIDTHMGSVLANPDLIKVYLGLSDEYKLPILFPRAYTSWFPPEVAAALNSKIFLLDNLFMIEPQMIKDKWSIAYKEGIEKMVPGLNQMIVHVAIDNDEMQAISEGHDDYGSKWRQNDLDFVLSNEFKDLLKTNDIILVTWKQIRDLMKDPDLKQESL